MRSTESFSVTLPPELVDMIKAKVAAGEYASESEVIRDGLRTLKARDETLAQWLRHDVAKSFDAYKADQSIGIPASQVSAALDLRLKAKRAE
jgi:putative addiction module CopG family antidote